MESVSALEDSLQRRQFLASSLAASAVALAPQSGAQMSSAKPREYYQIRKYFLQNGPQTKLTESYFADALIPALTKMGLGPIGAFRLEFGNETPTFYLLIPGSSVEALATIEFHLAADPDFMKAADPFWNAPAAAPAFIRVESSLLSAFEGWPKLTPPAKEKRTFQLRTYESPSYAAHVRKVEMFHHGEFDIFAKSGFHQVFFGDMLIGSRLPNLTYMLSAADMDQLNAYWKVFQNDPDWKKLSGSARYNYEPIVSSVTNLIMSPMTCSQI
jgi:hypothetical protein